MNNKNSFRTCCLPCTLWASPPRSRRWWTCSVRWRRRAGYSSLTFANCVSGSLGSLMRRISNKSYLRWVLSNSFMFSSGRQHPSEFKITKVFLNLSSQLSRYMHNIKYVVKIIYFISGFMWNRIPPSKVQSKEVQGSGKVLQYGWFPAHDDTSARASVRQGHLGHVCLRRQGQGWENILGRISGNKKTFFHSLCWLPL